MRVLNTHARRLEHPPEAVGSRLDTLATSGDALWPHERWPRMVFDKPLGIGARGGHGPIRYLVEEYDRSRRVVFRFTHPAGFIGTHGFWLEPTGEGCELRHTIDMRVTGSALLTWPLVFRPLHDALLEDALDKVEADLSDREWLGRDWSPWVRVLRRLLARRRRKVA